MTLYALPDSPCAFIFDIDGTLYTNPWYVKEQVDVQLRHLAHVRGIAAEEARRMVACYRAAWAVEHGGAKISLGNALVAFGVSIEESVRWREELLHPEEYLTPDASLIEALTSLVKEHILVCLTNNPVKAARRTLRAVGIEGLFAGVVGLDTCWASKPSAAMLDEALRIAGVREAQCVAVGDRFDIDLALPLKRGMGGALVEDSRDVVRLCAMFA